MKMFTKAIEKAFAKQGDTSQLEAKDIYIIAKFFNPVGGGTWYLYEKEDDDIYWCFANLGDVQMAECGTISMNEILAFRGQFGMKIERDMHFDPFKYTLQEVMDKIKSGGHI